ncbi:hypothetical protein PPSIR1_17065 [Plesiocystis pacifica SIR-1]|uniref:Dipeptidyl-peptidase n=1 Tax=Plesiocystis pacifica SIR-1 TaxID=391625 RepID=A6GI93_9BACT|nr:S46 family peptidase [Plesiocystis pacifica]EDM74395.1 hypothetical protein PPSIR1_17065 [Plesiocystis pacifica SIR-1]
MVDRTRLSLLTLPLAACLLPSWACTQPDTAPVNPDPDPVAEPDPEPEGPFENPGGMWMPGQLGAPDHKQQLQALGLEYDPAALTQPTEFPLGAIVSLGGCSASFVSNEGLIITNHHCVTGALARNSKPGENLLEDGFLAKTKAEERWAGPRQRVWVTNSFTDVTDQVLNGLEAIDDPQARFDEMNSRRNKLAKDCREAKEDVSCRVASYFEGAQFFLIEQIEIRDIRLVHAPDAGVGVYGGEIDNWRWPRHTGDYSFYRAYVGPDGKPADHAEDNVPYEPKHVLKVATEDLDEGDFVMVAGYPGRTSRLKTAGEVRDATDWAYPRKIARYEQYLAALDAAINGDEGLAIKANPRVRGLNNGLTNAKGMLEGLGKGGLAETAAKQQAELQAWIEADEQRAAAYGTVLAEIEALNDVERATRDQDAAFSELVGSSTLIRRAIGIIQAAEAREKSGEATTKAALASYKTRLEESQRSYADEIDRAVLRLHLERAAKLPAKDQPEALKVYLGGEVFDDKVITAAINKLYKKSKLDNPKAVLELYEKATPKKLAKSKDPAIQIALAIMPMLDDMEKRGAEQSGKMAVLRPRYIAAMREFAASQGKTLAPDANSTLRVTYGTVRGYQPEGKDEPYVPFTVASEMLAKHTGAEPFDLPEGVRKTIEAKNWGPYVDPELGEVPIDFLADLDITGGNSGSPTLNARGELIGLVFDGNYESMASDWVFMPEITRSIHVDIRSVLWVMDAVDGADHLLTEMGVTPSL